MKLTNYFFTIATACDLSNDASYGFFKQNLAQIDSVIENYFEMENMTTRKHSKYYFFWKFWVYQGCTDNSSQMHWWYMTNGGSLLKAASAQWRHGSVFESVLNCELPEDKTLGENLRENGSKVRGFGKNIAIGRIFCQRWEFFKIISLRVINCGS